MNATWSSGLSMVTDAPNDDPAVLRAAGLGKRYRSRWALEGCTIAIPRGRICGLVGANGAGKTTLLRLLVGLSRPSAGTVEVLGHVPAFEPDFLRLIGYLAQDVPLYRRWNVADHLTMGARLNVVWDGDRAEAHLAALHIPFDQKVGTLSGGQRAQVALALALAKQPRLLVLDEPVAALDPLARRGFLSTLMSAVAEADDLTVVLSSHLVSDLERVCDYVVVLDRARTQVCGELDDILAEHVLLTGPRRDTASIARAHTILREEHTARQSNLWVRCNGPVVDPAWTVAPLDFEEIVLAYLGGGQ